MIHDLSLNKNHTTFCWVPSHCDIKDNEDVDKAAKRGASNLINTIKLEVPLALHELKMFVNATIQQQYKEELLQQNNIYVINCITEQSIKHPSLILSNAKSLKSRKLCSLMFRIR